MLTQRIENVRTYANQTVTMSFWAKAASGTPKISFEFQQNFGSGGSPSTQVNTYAGQATLTTSWVRYTITATCPSISGYTIGTTANTSFLGINFWLSAGSTFNTRSGSIGIQNATFDIAGVQLEAGSVATAFQTATGTLQGELAACQRYYEEFSSSTTGTSILCVNQAISSVETLGAFHYQVTKRAAPTISYSGGTSGALTATASAVNGTLAFASITPYFARVNVTGASGLVAGNASGVYFDGVKLTINAEL
jgi:hypothetical protein